MISETYLGEATNSEKTLAFKILEKDKEIERLNNIIKEVREYIEKDTYRIGFMNANGKPTRENHILEILDKVGSDKE